MCSRGGLDKDDLQDQMESFISLVMGYYGDGGVHLESTIPSDDFFRHCTCRGVPGFLTEDGGNFGGILRESECYGTGASR